jgi:hypothetical protein
MHVHGVSAIQKEIIDSKLENIYHLPGGTVIPIRGVYTSSEVAYLQIIDGMEPQRFYPDELSFIQYIPVSSRSYPLVPVEALINKVAETLFFDKLMADTADGTRMPEKMIIINDASPFGDIDKDLVVPLNVDEQKRIETKMSTPIKGGVMTFTGNNATVVDLSRENTIESQRSRQKDIREECALVFNMSNMEINLSGSTFVSGRETSETQAEIDQGKGVIPILRTIEREFNLSILPMRFGAGFSLSFETSKNELEEVQLYTAKVNSGIYSINEIRVDDLNLMPFDDDSYNKPKGTATMPDGSTMNPLNIKNIGG